MIKIKTKSFLFGVFLPLTFSLQPSLAADNLDGTSRSPNVLFIAIDDMNDWTTLFDKANPIKTPNLERLAERGTFFARGYCNSPACNPSRASVLSGVRPSTSGVYNNSSNWNKAMPEVTILPQHFKNQGYQTYASGKIFHHHGTAFFRYEAFDEYLEFPTKQPDRPMPMDGNLNGIQQWTRPDGRKGKISLNFDWGVYPPDETFHIDNRTVDWAIDKIENTEAPFFIATGIFRPHMPFYAPQDWYDRYSMKDLVMPDLKEDDLADLPAAAKQMLTSRSFISTFRAEKARDAKIFDKAVRGYQAASSFADHNVGRLLDALDSSGKADTTVIVLWSDHGFHVGEKEHWEKFVLYEKATHIPYIIVAPGFNKGQVSYRPVTLVDLYPTLVELCGLPAPDHLEGESLVPLLKNPKAKKDPAIITYGQDNHAIRDDRYRYIRYADGGEELYDTENDPHEWNNLAQRTGSRKIMNELAKWLPDQNATPIESAKR
jgi:arylsulfatase A-like enzyme